ncbi:MAG: TRAP transporter large permease [Halovenus sp.]
MSIIGILLIFVFILLVLLRIPVAFALIIPSVAYVLLYDFSLFIVIQQIASPIFSFNILTVPLFILLGTFMNHSGIAERIFNFAENLLGHVRGGLAYVNIFASLFFSGMSGSAIADIGGIGNVLIESMGEKGYERDYSAALTAASATTGPIFPPSIPLIIYGLLANVSILSMLLAGVLPALLITIMLLLFTFLIGISGDFPPTSSRQSLRQILRSFLIAVPALATPFLLIFGMLLGLFSPTEVAAVTVVYMIVINIVIYGDFDWRTIWKASREAVQITSSVLFIVAGASLFAWVLTIEGVVGDISDLLLTFSGNPIMLMLMVNLMLVILGMFIDPLAALVLAVPLAVPPLVEAGFDPVHIGVVMVFNLMIGLLTPPMGLSVFVASDVSGAPVEEIIKKLWPYYIALFVALLIVSFVPWLSLFIPDLA